MQNPFTWFLRPRNLVLLLLIIPAYFLSQCDALGAAVGMIVFAPVKVILAVVVTSLVVHIWLSRTIDADKQSGRLLSDWNALAPESRATLTWLIICALFLGVAWIIAAAK